MKRRLLAFMLVPALLVLDVLPRLLQSGDNALVVLRHLVDELHVFSRSAMLVALNSTDR